MLARCGAGGQDGYGGGERQGQEHVPIFRRHRCDVDGYRMIHPKNPSPS